MDASLMKILLIIFRTSCKSELKDEVRKLSAFLSLDHQATSIE